MAERGAAVIRPAGEQYQDARRVLDLLSRSSLKNDAEAQELRKKVEAKIERLRKYATECDRSEAFEAATKLLAEEP